MRASGMSSRCLCKECDVTAFLAVVMIVLVAPLLALNCALVLAAVLK